MRSVLSTLGRFGSMVAGRGHSGRPENLRRGTLANNARLVIGGSLIASPFAVFALVGGHALPFVVTTLWIGTGVLSLAFCRERQYERSAAAQVYGTMLTGLLLALLDPAIVDFGLATALLAPVHASLLARSPVKKRSWVLLVAVVALAALASLGLLSWPDSLRGYYGLTSSLCFAAAAIMVAYSANRLNSAFEVYDKSQIRAYRHLIEHVQDAVMRFAPDGQVLFASRSTETLFGSPRYELTAHGLIDRIHVLDRPAYLTAFAEANVDGRGRTVEMRMRRDDPSGAMRVPQFIWVEASLSPVTEDSRGAERFEVVALLRDVSARKDIEISMREARKTAEEASIAKSRFLAIIGHELRTPLNAIVGFSEMMTSGVVGELAPTHKEYAELIRQSGHHLIEVVRMLLDMSRIEAGKFELHTEPMQPDALVEPCLKMIGGAARERQVRLVTDLPLELPTVVADERACRQILINLLSNAVKFSADGGQVRLGMRRQGGYLAITVTDHGIGMSAEAIARIGEPFFQAQEGLTRGYEGTGLGLSIVKGLIDLHEGKLEVHSALGQGTRVTVLLPLNGPATKLPETGAVAQLRSEPVSQPMPAWRDEKRQAL